VHRSHIARLAEQAGLGLIRYRKGRDQRMLGLARRQKSERCRQRAFVPSCPAQVVFGDRADDRPALRPKPNGLVVLLSTQRLLVNRPRRVPFRPIIDQTAPL